MDGLVMTGIIYHPYHTCADEKCLRALRNCEGAFCTYKDQSVEVVGYTTSAGTPEATLNMLRLKCKRTAHGSFNMRSII
jgi:predicted metal-binding protein